MSKAQRRNTLRRKPPLTISDGTITIRKLALARLKTDQDFIDLNRVGRMINAVNYSMERSIAQAFPIPKEGYRTYNRETTIMTSYLSEALLLIKALKERHENEPYFYKFKNLLSVKSRKKRDKLFHLVRNNGGFHFDQDNTSTKKALEKLKNANYALLIAKDKSFGNLYFCFADTLDLNFMIDELKADHPGKTEAEILEITHHQRVELLSDVIEGSDQFIRGIAEKLKLTNWDYNVQPSWRYGENV